MDDGGQSTYMDLQSSKKTFLYRFPDLGLQTILSHKSIDKSFDFMFWFELWCALSTVGPDIDECVPFQILCNQLNQAQVDSN